MQRVRQRDAGGAKAEGTTVTTASTLIGRVKFVARWLAGWLAVATAAAATTASASASASLYSLRLPF